MSLAVRITAQGGGTSGSGDRAVSHGVQNGDLCLVLAATSGNTNTAPTCSDSDGGTYTLITSGLWGSSANAFCAFIGNAGKTGTATITTTVATGSNTAGQIWVFKLTGWPIAGIALVVQSTKQENQAASGTPASTFTNLVGVANMTVVAVANSSSPSGMVQPTGWLGVSDSGQSTPSTGLGVTSRATGFSGTTITWGSTSASVFGSIGIELGVATTSLLPLLGVG